MEEIKPILAKNIAALRTARGLTQWELAEKLHYSDKAVSKWERGESVPDIAVLRDIAALFHVTVDELISDGARTPSPKAPGSARRSRRIIAGISLLGVCCAALLLFALTRSLLTFAIAVPAGLIVWLVLNTLWFDRRRNYLIVSLLMWSLLLIACILCAAAGAPMWLLMLIGAPGQAIIWLCSRLKRTEA